MGSSFSCLRPVSAPPAHQTLAAGPTESEQFREEGLILRGRLASLHHHTPGFRDETALLERIPATFRPHWHRVELLPGSLAARLIHAAFQAFGGHIEESRLRDILLRDAYPGLRQALADLLHYHLIDFSQQHESDPHCRSGILGNHGHCYLPHRLAVAGRESRDWPLVERLNMLKRAGVSLDVACARHETPLMWAARWGGRTTAGALLAAGADPLKYDSEGLTALHLAARCGKPEMVKYLIRHGCPIDVPSHNARHWTPLHVAAAAGRCAAIRVLREMGANLNARGKNEESPLLLAVRRHRPEAIVALLEPLAGTHSAGVNLSHSEDRLTALHWAARIGSPQATARLLEFGANPNARTTRGLTPLHYAGLRISEGSPADQVSIVEALLAAGANINSPDQRGNRPADFAGIEGNEAVFDYLLSRGALHVHDLDVNVANP